MKPAAWLLLGVLVLPLAGCGAGDKLGIRNLNTAGVDEPDQDEKDDANFWDYFYGHKVAGRESKEWKDYYKPPNKGDSKPDYCGFWGNCADDDTSGAANCNFYGNCKGTSVKQGWW